MRILLTGCGGQLGYELQRSVPDHHQLIPVNKEHLDITKSDQIRVLFEKEKPDLVINAAACHAIVSVVVNAMCFGVN